MLQLSRCFVLVDIQKLRLYCGTAFATTLDCRVTITDAEKMAMISSVHHLVGEQSAERIMPTTMIVSHYIRHERIKSKSHELKCLLEISGHCFV